VQLSAVGDKVVKIFDLVGDSGDVLIEMQSVSLGEEEGLCHAQLVDGRLAVGTAQNKVLIVDVVTSSVVNEMVVYQEDAAASRVECIASLTDGFVCGGHAGVLHRFTLTKGGSTHKNAASDKTPDIDDDDTGVPQNIYDIAVKPDDTMLVTPTDAEQLHAWHLLPRAEGERGKDMEPLPAPLQPDPILGLMPDPEGEKQKQREAAERRRKAENEAKQKLREEQARLREEVRKREEEKAKILKTLDAEAQITACPDVKVDLSKGRIEILKPITFEKNESDLIGEGENILNQVAATFVAVQALSEKHGLPLPRFLVEGHTNCTDPKKRESKFHMTLSSDRSERCLFYLTQTKAANPDMLAAQGFGGVVRVFERERDEDVTLNQRVEFNLLNAEELVNSIQIKRESVTGHTDK